MNLQADALCETDCDDAEASAAARRRVRARIEDEQAKLARIADMAFSIAEVVEAEVRAVGAERDAPEEARTIAAIERRRVLDDLGLTFTRVTRALRLTFLLQARLDAALEEMAFDAKWDAEEAARKPKALNFNRSARAQLVVEAVAQNEHPGDTETVERITREACERMRDDDDFRKLLAGPISDAIAYLCGQVGLSPDWTKLVNTRWAQEEIRSGKVGANLAAAIKPAAPPPDAAPSRFSEVGDTRTIVIPPLPPEPRRKGRRPGPW